MKQALIRGIKIAIPILVTFLIAYWLIYTVESVFKAILLPLIPDRFYFPGLGALVGFVIIFLIGTTINAWMVNWIYKKFDKLMNKIPVINTLYPAIQDFMGMLDSEKETFGSPVILDFQGTKMMGLVTCKTLQNLKSQAIGEQDIAVYLPMSYQMGGFTIIVPSSLVKPLNMSVQDAMKFILTAGIVKHKA